MFQYKPRIGRQALLQNDHRAVTIDAQGSGVESCRLALQRHVDVRAYAKQHSLAAPPFLTRDSLRSPRSAGLGGTRLPPCATALTGVI